MLCGGSACVSGCVCCVVGQSVFVGLCAVWWVSLCLWVCVLCGGSVCLCGSVCL